MLETLRAFDAKATFFCIGDNVHKHPDIFKQLTASGHKTGNHTFNHLAGWKTEDELYMNNIEKCAELVSSNLFRPPYGRLKNSQIRQLKKYSATNPLLPDEIVMWDVLSGDFDLRLKPEHCLRNVLKHTENGSIVVFHDSLKAWARLEYTLPKALNFWAQKGYKFAAL